MSEQHAVCCPACGREYHDLSESEVDRLTSTGKCPSDDCPGPTRYHFAVIGRVIGDDEDTCHAFWAEFREEAVRLFREKMLGGISESEMADLIEQWGEDPCVITTVIKSIAEMEIV